MCNAATLSATHRGRTLLRVLAGLGPRDYRYPVTLVDGASPPEDVGSSGYWTTPSGKTVVIHPRAYGWPVVYHCSTREIRVGRNWAPGQRPARAGLGSESCV